MEIIQQFRTSVRGFNRQDVQEYIEKMSAAHHQDMGELQKKLDKSEERVAQLEETVSGIPAIEEELAGTKAALNQSEQMVSRLRGELSQADAKLSVAKKEMERLQAAIARLEPLAASYREIKDKAVSVELDAHQKAQAELSGARAEAERVRADTRKWLSRVLEEYSCLRHGVDSVVHHLQMLEYIPEKMDKLDESTSQLRELGGLK